ncbi:MAG: TolC family protein [Fimbriimonadaceae bacterium]|nr:TolC family protein [Fimbriimonadaceae bacterium]
MSLVAFLALAPGLMRQDPVPVLTYQEAIQIAVDNAFAIRGAEIEAARAQDLVDLAKVAQGLNVSVSSSYTRTESRGDSGAQPNTGGGFGPVPDSTQVSLTVSQVIDISGAIRTAVQQARFNRQTAQFLLETEISRIRALVKTSYLNILAADESVDIRRAAVDSAEARLKTTQTRVAAGAVPRFDALRLETDLSQARKDLLDARNAARLTRQTLNNVMARPIETPFTVQSADIRIELPGEDGTLAAAAIRTRPDLKAAASGIEALKQALARERLGLAPQLSVGVVHTESLGSRPVGQPPGTTSARIQVTLPLYDSGLTRTRVRSAEKDVARAEISLEQARLGASLEVRAALAELRSNQEAAQVAAKTVELSAEALRLAQLRYDEGVGILLDVTVAQNQLTTARSAEVASRFQALNSYVRLLRAVGTDDLAAAVAALPSQNEEK